MPAAVPARWLLAALTLAPLSTLAGLPAAPAAAACSDPAHSLGVTRIVEIDAARGPVFGGITKQHREHRFLGPKEVVLTFDDGPMPGVTRQILDTLDQFCIKATFFSVGRMAVAYPDSVREILRRGHTLGTHTWSHPMSLPRLSRQQARDQIESGFAAVALAAGQPIAPFFRFPGLNDSAALVAHLETRNIATFTVDVVSNDSYIADPKRLFDTTMRRLEEENGGIVLFHDIKPQTARALPAILAEMRRRGYKIVHLRAKQPFQPDQDYMTAVRQHVAERKLGPQRGRLLAITEAADPPVPQPGAAPTPPPEKVAAPATPEPPVSHVALGDPAVARRPLQRAPAAPAAKPVERVHAHAVPDTPAQRPVKTATRLPPPVTTPAGPASAPLRPAGQAPAAPVAQRQANWQDVYRLRLSEQGN